MGGPGSGRKKGSGGKSKASGQKAKSGLSTLSKSLLKESNKNARGAKAKDRIAKLQSFRK